MQLRSFTFVATLCSVVSYILAYDVILDRNFGEKKACLSGLESNVQYSDGTAIGILCQHDCVHDSFTSRTQLSFLPIIQNLDMMFKYDMTTFTQAYSYIQFEMTFMSRGSSSLKLYVNTATNIYDITGSSTVGVFEDASPVLCGSTPMSISQFSIKIAKSDFASVSPVNFTISETSSSGSASLRSVLITSNCMANCKACGSTSSCTTCNDGFNSYSVSGNTVCELVGSCATSNCRSCTYDGTCRSCYPGYTLNGSSCDANTSGSSCTATQYYDDSGMCMAYSSVGYVQDWADSSYVAISELTTTQIQTQFKCPYGKTVVLSRVSDYSQYTCRCFVDDCKWCSAKSTCDLCTTGLTFNTTTKTCVVGSSSSSSSNSFTLRQTVIDSGYEIRIAFASDLLYSTITIADIALTISDYTSFTYSFVSLENTKTILLQVDMQTFAKNKDITVQINNPTFVASNFLTNSQYSTTLDAYVYISESDREASKTVASIGSAASTAIVSTLIPIVILSQFSSVVSTIDLTGFLYYLLYIDARFPINVTSFYALFKNFQLDFIPNFFSDIVSAGYHHISKVRFMQQDTDSYFLTNTGQSVTIFLIIMMVYLFVKIMAQMDFAFVSAYFKKAAYETWEYGGFFDAVWTIYIYLLVGVLMQFQSFDCSDSSSCATNYIVFSLSFIVSFAVPMYVTRLIYSTPNLKENEYMKIKISSLIASVRLFSEKESLLGDNEGGDATPSSKNNEASSKQEGGVDTKNVAAWREKYAKKYTKYYMPILYLRKILFALIIVALNPFGYVQLTLISLLNIGMVMYFLLLRPLESKYENIKGAISEVVMIVFQILVGTLLDDPEDQDESDRIKIGWVAIALVSLVIVWHAVGIIFDFVIAVIQGIKTMYQKGSIRSSSKVFPVQQQDDSPKSGEDQLVNVKDTHIPLKQKAAEVDESIRLHQGEFESTNQSPVLRKRVNRANPSFTKRESTMVQSSAQQPFSLIEVDSATSLQMNSDKQLRESSPVMMRTPPAVTKKKTALIQMISAQAAQNPNTMDILYEESQANHPLSANQSYTSQQEQGLLRRKPKNGIQLIQS